ncbi:heterocyst formation protein HetP-like protein [Richelia sinica FACHB-800]|uniref:Heterocyst formation protein HetP-like protein n=1 Tax=Richelia sinica FACHB-800 TaxID=1357546 RepID=A0A975Y5X3_9NOST|nr:HetP family heterocyst commitment protein [Richelia sinica]MBD2663487.1 HetP family heterocyst commitment protein [Richelia sinica FACHB-800]QXE24673.1 heterocyst formation protein HetP-like protein [Richelia sinica FACHB-800]
MTYQLSSSHNNSQSGITPEQFNQIIEAIADGKYSWACVLILRFIGYNPIHYIPQRTYSRLIKDNSRVVTTSPPAPQKTQAQNQTSVHPHHHLSFISKVRNYQ